MLFTHAILRKPGQTMIHGITTAQLGQPDYARALEQHACYVEALQSCGVNVTVLAADENFPDATFVEDTAVVTKTCAVITRPGAASRQGEEVAIEEALLYFYPIIAHIQAPGTLDGGDVMLAGDYVYVGLSTRTNAAGAQQLIRILGQHGYHGVTVPLNQVLHLKTGVSYLEHNTLLLASEFVGNPIFAKFQTIMIEPAESYAANSLWVNDRVLVAAGFPKTREAIARAGYETIVVDMSEFHKLDGGLSCLSLRF